jgi:hypothetical protein
LLAGGGWYSLVSSYQHLKNAGRWALDVATKIGVNLATEALKKALGS